MITDILQRFEFETEHVNLSLHYLEQVMVSLGQEGASHIPYINAVNSSLLNTS